VLFKGVGPEGQQRLAQARVVIVDAGRPVLPWPRCWRVGRGHAADSRPRLRRAEQLAAASVISEEDARESVPKAIAAARQIARFNSQIVVEPHVADLVPANVDALLGGCDLILDGTDNFETRYLVNDYAVKNSVAWIYAAAVGSYAVTMNILPGETACLACIFPESRAERRDLRDIRHFEFRRESSASIAATEALKFLVGARVKMRGTLLSWDVWTNERAEMSAIHRRRDAALARGFVHLAGEGRPHITLCGRNSVQIHERQRPVDFAELSVRLQLMATFATTSCVEVLARAYEMTLFPDGRAIIKGTTDTAVARSLYARYVGT